jgi:carbonic anhydrase
MLPNPEEILLMRTTITALLVLGFATAAHAQSPQPTDWTYQGKTGALVWGKIRPEYQACGKGNAQSPIDIRGARVDSDLDPIEFHYVAGSVIISNTGQGIEVQVNPGSYIIADDVRYNLIRYEFHHPSEHTVHGKFTDMELDLIHRSADNKEAVIAVRLTELRQDPNAMLATLWEKLPQQPGKSEKITAMVNPGGLLPGNRTYWTYMGSELTPPCTEGVRWFVFVNDVSISRSQLNAFVALYKTNTRPTQDLNDRKITANGQ